MFKNLIIGQYIDTGSPIHKLNPAFKIIMTVLFTVLLFWINGFLAYINICILLLMLIALSGVPIRLILKGIKPVMFLALFTLVMNSFLTDGHVIWQLWKIKLTYEGLELGILFAVRLVFLVCAASILTLTTAPLELTDGIEKLLLPLSKLKIPTHDIAMMMTIAIRFIPTLGEEAARIMDAQASRGADFEDGNIIKKAKALMPVLIPLFISAFRHSDELAVAMDARCYSGKSRTKMNEKKITAYDIRAAIIFILIGAALIGIDYLM